MFYYLFVFKLTSNIYFSFTEGQAVFKRVSGLKDKQITNLKSLARRYNSYKDVDKTTEDVTMSEEIPKYNPSSVINAPRNFIECVEIANRAKEDMDQSKKEGDL